MTRSPGSPDRPENEGNPIVLEEVPWSESLTSYDEAHLTTYIRLLDAEADGASVETIARLILRIDPSRDSDQAARTVSSHLRRAHWMTETGYRHLLRGPSKGPGTARLH